MRFKTRIFLHVNESGPKLILGYFDNLWVFIVHSYVF